MTTTEAALDSATRSDGQTVRPAEVPRRRLGLIIAVVLVITAALFGVRRWRWGLTHEKTDDAQVDGHVIPVLAKVGGYVATVRVIENKEVHAGDTLAILDDRDVRAALENSVNTVRALGLHDDLSYLLTEITD